MSDIQPKEAWLACCCLAMFDGIDDLVSRDPPLYTRDIDGHWKITFNGGKEPANVNGAELPQFEILVEFNGWPAGVFGPGGGIIAAGEVANEDALIAAIEKILGKSVMDYLASQPSPSSHAIKGEK